jgi:hypothetical protein
MLRRILLACYLLLAPSLTAWACEVATPADWMSSSGLPVLPVRPAHCAAVSQSPPDFNWPHRRPGDRYQLVVRSVVGVEQTVSTTANWHMWDKPFAPGTYTWWVVANDPAGKAWRSASREFTLLPGTPVFVVPATASLLAQAQARPHPRGLPQGTARDELVRALAAERGPGWRQLLARVDADLKRGTVAEPTVDPRNQTERADQVKVIQSLWAMMNVEQTRVLEAALVAVLTPNADYLAHAHRLILGLAAWNPDGPSSHSSQFQVNRALAVVLAIGYDWLYDSWSAGERTALLRRIGQRMVPIVSSAVGPARNMENNALNSVGLTNLGVVAGVAALTAGDLASADEWFEQALPLYANLLWPWGGDDGGYANGLNYAMWEVADALWVLDSLRNATGLDLGTKPYLRNFGRMLAYFLPPGSRHGLFGDGAEQEMPHVYARYVKALALRVDSPELAWLAAQSHGEDISNIALLAAPVSRAGGTLPPPAQNDLALLSVGWVAMHSSLPAHDRVSVYFKSSPYGSISHSHAEQNSFVLHVGSEPLLMAGGQYDWYGSPHGLGYYKQTRAHNAVTFDGGKGQAILAQGASGQITGFQSGDSLAWVDGDATPAYGGSVNWAWRRIYFFKPDLVMIEDKMSSSLPRRWEINLHAAEPLRWRDEQLEISNGKAKGCGTVWTASGLDFEQATEPLPLSVSAGVGARWHGIFRARGLTTELHALTVVDLACRASGRYIVRPAEQGFNVIAGEANFRVP